MSEGNGKLLTIPEAAELYNKHSTTIYKAIQKGQLNSVEILQNSKRIMKVKEAELIQLYGHHSTEFYSNSTRTQSNSTDSLLNSTEFIRNQMKAVIEEYFQDRETKLMRPIEEMAIYKVGKLENEIEHLKLEKELILKENEILQKAMKALPGPIEEITIKLQKLEQTDAEKADIASQLDIAVQLKQTALKEKAKAAAALQTIQQEKERLLSEKENTVRELRQHTDELQKEKEILLSQKEKEMAEIKEQFEKQKEEIADAWRKELEAERNRPWWKRLFSF